MGSGVRGGQHEAGENNSPADGGMGRKSFQQLRERRGIVGGGWGREDSHGKPPKISLRVLSLFYYVSIVCVCVCVCVSVCACAHRFVCVCPV